MSSCCFPKLSCLKPKNKIRSASEVIERNTQLIKTNSSITKHAIQVSGADTLSHNKSLPEVSKTAKAQHVSHKSTIVIKLANRFQQQKLKTNVERDDSIASLSISKISKQSISDISTNDFFGDIKLVDKDRCYENTRIPRGLKKKSLDYYKIIMGHRKKEMPPMFLKNPCFGNNEGSAQRCDEAN